MNQAKISGIFPPLQRNEVSIRVPRSSKIQENQGNRALDGAKYVGTTTNWEDALHIWDRIGGWVLKKLASPVMGRRAFFNGYVAR